MSAMKKRFLLWSFLVGYSSFGGLLWLDQASDTIWYVPAACFLFCLGCAGPIVGGIFSVRQSGCALSQLISAASLRPWLLAGMFLVLHFGMAILLGFLLPPTGSSISTLLMIPASVLLGAQELGWRMVLQPALARTRPRWKAALAAALLHSLWLLPILFLSWSPVKADLYLPMACCVAGMSFLSSTLRQLGGGWVCLSVFSSLFFLLNSLMPMSNENGWYVMAGVDLLLSFLYTSRLVKENEAQFPSKQDKPARMP